MIKNPDFIIIPHQLVINKNLQPNDRLLYGVIYWFERLKDGKCTASNSVLSEVLGCEIKSVQNGLDRLEKERYIIRLYKDDNKRTRKEIKSLIVYSEVSLNRDRVSLNRDTEVSLNRDQNKNIYNKNTKEYIATSPVAGNDIPRLIKKFEPINPSTYKLYGNTTQRSAIERLVEKHGLGEIEKLIDYVVSIYGKEYAPRITTPHALENKLGDLGAYIKSQGGKENVLTIRKKK